MQILSLCDIGEQSMEQLHHLYDIPIAPPPGPRRRGRARGDEIPVQNEPPVQYDEAHHDVDDIPPFTQTQTQNYASPYTPTMTMPLTESYHSASSSSYAHHDDVGPSSSSHRRGRGRGEHESYVYPIDPIAEPEDQHQAPIGRRRQPARNRRRPPCGTH